MEDTTEEWQPITFKQPNKAINYVSYQVSELI